MESNSKPRKLFQGSLALLCTLLVVFLIIFVVVHPVYFPGNGPLSNTKRSVYITGVTIAGTICTAYLSSVLQALLARKFDSKLEIWDIESPVLPLNREWRAVTNLDNIVGKFRTIHIHYRYWIAALTTAMLTASLTPTRTTREFHYVQHVHDGPSTHMLTVGNCTGVFKLPLQDPYWPYYWDIGNDEVFLVQTKEGDCPTREAQISVGNINTIDPSLYTYMEAGVAVHRSANGVPRSMYSPEAAHAPDLDRIMQLYGPSLVSTRQCSRVMARNPISCHPGGSIVWQSQWLNISADNGHCNAARRFSEAEFAHYYSGGGGVMLKTMCAHGEIGQGTMVIGAEGGFAHWLAVGVNDTNGAPPAAPGSTYVVTCTVDARDVFEYREVSLQLRSTDAEQNRYMRYLKATGNKCRGPPIIRDIIATAASANWQTLFQENAGSGWWDLVWEASNTAHGPRSAPFGFPESTNAMEDTLGLVAAMVTARMNSTATHTVNSTAVVEATRIGNGQRSSLCFAIPPFLVAIILSGMLFRTLGRKPSKVDSTNLKCLLEFKSTK
ncbi:hypothetical protein Forpe1208_v011782 [Fusarium oxysporum f. sp. rapae]|uniref:Uncharacterized protein n=1 Tax=Fusarium oxysporum f. sp. rapae TaxID=485398 RepID=A0A8J5TSM6_FUSOX|nr:hypothetical protein Forpe1208_v011782 [Fusarium oxysporum f. sp. rapae]